MGRKPGGKNRPISYKDCVQVKQIPRCRECNSTELKVIQSQSMPVCDTINGRPYDSVRIQRVVCSNCEAVMMLRSHHYKGEDLKKLDEFSTE